MLLGEIGCEQLIYPFPLIVAGTISAFDESVVNMDGSISFLHNSAGVYGGKCLPAQFVDCFHERTEGW